MIFPEGGRSPDGWGQPFKGGAAYLSARTGAPVVPMYIEGTGRDLRQGHEAARSRARPRSCSARRCAPTRARSTRRFNARIEAAVDALGDEALTDSGPPASAPPPAPTRRSPAPTTTAGAAQWALAEHRKLGKAGVRRRQKRRWPDLG